MYQKQILPNGLTVITAPLKETQTVTVLLLVKAGSRYEQKEVAGVSHFIEHLMFKGTKKRPSALILSKELDSVGADYNAFTAKDHTGYYIKVNADKLELALDLLSDMVFNSLFDNEELNREKAVIIEEINMYQDNPIMHVEDLVEELIFKGNKLGWLIIGSKKTVKGINRQKIMAAKDKFYQPGNMVLSLAGKLKTKDLKLIEKYFSGQINKKRKIGFTDFKTKQSAQQTKAVYKKTDQLQMALGWPAFGYGHQDIYAAHLLAIILGGNMSSRLFIEIRERRGLAYYIRAMNNVYQDTGCLVIQAGLDKKRWLEAVEIILEEIKLIKKQGVKPEELKRAKEFFKGKLAIELEDSAQLAGWYGRQNLLVEQILKPEEKIKKLFKVKQTDIQRAAKKIFVKNKLNLVTIGPLRDLSQHRF